MIVTQQAQGEGGDGQQHRPFEKAGLIKQQADNNHGNKGRRRACFAPGNI